MMMTMNSSKEEHGLQHDVQEASSSSPSSSSSSSSSPSSSSSSSPSSSMNPGERGDTQERSLGEREGKQEEEKHEEKQDNPNDDNANEEQQQEEEQQEHQEEEEEEQQQHQEEEKRSQFFETRIERAEELKEEGNQLYANSRYHEALTKYEKSLFHSEFDELSYNFELHDQHRDIVDRTRLPALLNSAACHVMLIQSEQEQGRDEHKSQEFINDHASQTITLCDQALKVEPESVKALFRRATAKRAIGSLEDAKANLLTAAKIAPTNKSIRRMLNAVQDESREITKAQEAFWKDSFEKRRRQTRNEQHRSDDSSNGDSNGDSDGDFFDGGSDGDGDVYDSDIDGTGLNKKPSISSSRYVLDNIWHYVRSSLSNLASFCKNYVSSGAA